MYIFRDRIYNNSFSPVEILRQNLKIPIFYEIYVHPLFSLAVSSLLLATCMHTCIDTYKPLPLQIIDTPVDIDIVE